RYDVLDAWRGICALLVAIYHLPLAHRFQDAGWFFNLQLLVDFFFVLSGFVIAHSYGARIIGGRAAQGFMIRRFGRLWPLHAAVLMAFVLIELAKLIAARFVTLPLDGAPFTANNGLPELAGNVLLVQAMNLFGHTSWNTPAWSIGVEFYTYLVFALAVLAFGVRRAVFAALALAGAAGIASFSPQWLFATHDFGFFRCVFGFFTGVLAYGYGQRFRNAAPASSLMEWLAVLMLIAYLALTGMNASSLLAPLLFALVILVFAQEQGVVSTALRARSMQALGRWSYSIYLVHSLVYALQKILLTLIAKAFPALGLSAPVAVPVKLWTFGHWAADLALLLGVTAIVVALSAFT
ncbi:MAG: acyltransferase family protein, partial [Beijerinckiaceae bacterium]